MAESPIKGGDDSRKPLETTGSHAYVDMEESSPRQTPRMPVEQSQGDVNQPQRPAQQPPTPSSPKKQLPRDSNYPSEAIISVPDAGLRAQGGVYTHQPYPTKTKARSNLKPIEIVVYFMDKTGINLTVEDGQHAEAGELFEMVMDEMHFPPETREAFSLWLVSDLLEVQLKPDHCPFKLVCYWEELLEKYTNTEEDDRERDEPVIMFQRNAFLSRNQEKSFDNAKLVYLLYHEAKEAVVDGRYPLELDEYDYLAGLQALIKNGYSSTEHTSDFYKSSKQEYYPEIFCKNKWSFPGMRKGKTVEERLAAAHRARAEEFRGHRAQESSAEAFRQGLYSVYLDFCRKLPFYGATFFKGQIERPGGKSLLKSSPDEPVYIAVNNDGVSVIDMDDVKFLLFLRYEELSWEYAEPQDKDNPDNMPCLFLQFAANDEGMELTKLLQIFSREASLMDAMIDTCVKDKKRRRKEYGGDQVDGAATATGKGVIKAQGEAWKDFNKLCLATFNKSGQCIDYTARGTKY